MSETTPDSAMIGEQAGALPRMARPRRNRERLAVWVQRQEDYALVAAYKCMALSDLQRVPAGREMDPELSEAEQ